MTEPTTAAGDDLLTDLINDHEGPSYHIIEIVRTAILAIEAEARQQDTQRAKCYCGRFATCENGLCQMHHANSAKVLGNPCYVEATRLAALAPSAPPVLDVERLARALQKTGPFPNQWAANLRWAEAILASLQEQDRSEKGTGGAE